MATARVPVTPSIFSKPQILRNHLNIWKRTAAPPPPPPPKHGFILRRRRSIQFLAPLPHHLRFAHHFLQTSHPNLRLLPPLIPLLHPRLSPPMSSLDSSPDSTLTKTVRVVIKGRVQGVFYRNWTIDNATDLGLKGWVRNRRDGSVEALFSGDSAKVEEMEQRCRRGPPVAMVTGLEDAGPVFFHAWSSHVDSSGVRHFLQITFSYINCHSCLVRMSKMRGALVSGKVFKKALMRIQSVSRKLTYSPLSAVADDRIYLLKDGLPWDVKAGHFVVHTVNDGEAKRFIIALNFLAHPGFLKLLDQAEEEFGFKQEGVLTVPCGPSELRRILKT
ncbi:hypothetical protein RJ640_007150 [Escallonia rubra]|uniref:acylphosphatase n=1 Tax=Escallonia rubra TaxID=112253 RepID=A0AA88QX42_9ASTE|nr:hypothetical protein RJ640_007150 [Escallonia rubra]